LINEQNTLDRDRGEWSVSVGTISLAFVSWPSGPTSSSPSRSLHYARASVCLARAFGWCFTASCFPNHFWRTTAMLCYAMLCFGTVVVRPLVCPSVVVVCHGCIVAKRCKIVPITAWLLLIILIFKWRVNHWLWMTLKVH